MCVYIHICIYIYIYIYICSATRTPRSYDILDIVLFYNIL